MGRPLEMRLLSADAPAPGTAKGWAMLDIPLAISGDSHPLRLAVRGREAQLSDLVPLAQGLASAVIRTATTTLKARSLSVSCHKTCHACCRYMVPLSVPEAGNLARRVLAMPGSRGRTVQEAFVAAASTILQHACDLPPSGTARREEVSQWYSELNLSCPFLSEGVCTIYSHRPLACREHLVTTSPAACEPNHIDDASRVDLPVSVLEVLSELTAEVEGTGPEAILLPLAPAWYECNTARVERVWPVMKLVERFLSLLNTQASRRKAA